jgi:tape measure domain-containing protein
MSQTDVQLVIKAKNEASTAVTAVADAIKSLTGAQDKMASSGGATATLLDQLKNASTALAAAIQKTDDAVTRAQESYERQAKTLAETEAQLGAVKVQMEAAEKSAATLNAQIVAGGEGATIYKTKLESVTLAQRELNTQAKQLTSSIASQQAALSKSAAALASMQSAGRSAGSAATFALVTPEAAVETAETATAATRLASSLPAIAPAAAEANRATGGLWQSIKSLTAGLLTIPAAERDAEGSLTGFGGSMRNSLNMSQRLRTELLSLTQTFVGLYAAVAGIRAVLNAYQALQSAENKLGVVFGQNQSQVAAELDFLRSEATRLGLSFTQLTDQYSSFAVAAQSAGFSLGGTRKIFVAMADASRVLHLSTEQVNNVFLALTEMMSKGLIQSTQLRKQLGTDLPGAVSLFADALGISTEKLDQLMRRGELFADEDTFSKIADRLNQKYGAQLPQALQTAQTQIGRFQSLLQQAEINVGKGGFIDALNAGLQKLNGFLQTDDARRFFTGIGAALGNLVGTLPAVARNFNLITAAFKAWLAVKIDLWLLGVVRSMGTVASVARAMWAAIGGVPGLLIAGVSFALESVLGEWLTGVDKATAALDEHERILEAVKRGYEDAGQKVDGWAKKIQNTTQAQALASLQTLQQQAAIAKQNLSQLPLDRAPVDSAVSAKTGILGAVIPNALRDQLNDIIQKFKDGKTSYEDFKRALSDFGVAHPQFLQFTKDVLDQAQKFGDLQTAIKQANAELRVITGHGTAGDLKTLGIDAANGWQNATVAIDGFGDALNNLRKQVPDLKRQLGFEQNLENAAAAYQQAVKKAVQGFDQAGGNTIDTVVRAATTAERLGEAKQVYDEVVAKIHAYAAADEAKNFPLDNKAIIERIIYVESNGSVTAKNPNSSAAGLGQVTRDTWISIFKEVFPGLADKNDDFILAYRSNTEVMMKVLEELTRQNEIYLAQHNVPLTPANVYLAHFLGPQTAVRMILANPSELASDISKAVQGNDKQVLANPTILGNGHTAADVLNFANSKMGGASPITSTGATELENFNAALQEQEKSWDADATALANARGQTELQAQAAARALAIQKEVDEWEKRALADHTTLSDADRKAIELKVGALYDEQHAAENVQKVVDQIVGISEQRATAIQELQNAFKDGSDSETVEALKQKVNDLTAALQQVLPLAQQTVATFGDQKQVETLQKVNQQLATLKTGLTDAKQMNTLLADGVTSAWDNFTQSLQQSRKILVDLRTAFLQFAMDFARQIGDMILKQDVLNALSGTGVGNWLSKFVNGATGTDTTGGAALTAAGTTLTSAGTALATAAAALQEAAISLVASSAGGGTGGALSLAQSAELFASTLHTGGIAGTDGIQRSVSATIFAGARRFHKGGLPGLSRSEVPAILQRGEEVIRRDDPRHILNGGGAAPTVNVKNVNVFDPGEAFAQGLTTKVGERAVFNFVRNNKTAFNAHLA